ncbi:hypothetical protein EDD11_008784 [Mortierella claussenii]|nr:hypothetical protein EDD11_008784 [Mortierella claussenii]
MISTTPISRLVSVANATKMVRALPKRTFTSFGSASKLSSARQEAFASRSHLHQFVSQKESPFSRLFSTSPFAAKPNTTSSFFSKNAAAESFSPIFQTQPLRGFSRRAWRDDHEAMYKAAHEYWRGGAGVHQGGHHGRGKEWRVSRCHGFRGYHDSPHFMPRRHRSRRFLFRAAVLSTVLVAVPAVVVFDAPYRTLAFVPLTVLGVGGVLMLTGRLLYIALPVVAIGGATAFWVTVMPAANTAKDLKKILKRDKNSDRYTTALSTLGTDWEIQAAQSNEWFRWTFPERSDKKQLDKVDISMSVFDPNDHSDRKAKVMQMIDKMQKRMSSEKDKPGCNVPQSLTVKRQGAQISIHMEEDGEKIMEQKMAKKYLALGRIVVKAAKEMEAAQPGLNLGEQLVLVHKKKNRDESSWGSWSPYGDLSLRIPFNRTWVNDLQDL